MPHVDHSAISMTQLGDSPLPPSAGRGLVTPASQEPSRANFKHKQRWRVGMAHLGWPFLSAILVKEVPPYTKEPSRSASGIDLQPSCVFSVTESQILLTRDMKPRLQGVGGCGRPLSQDRISIQIVLPRVYELVHHHNHSLEAGSLGAQKACSKYKDDLPAFCP
ncbi:hypothetical protein LIA77_08956 [Sarocladium implicatum]|nr:hypothetical protein LIA77_08956 [Sarocladium implicatum]